MNGLSILIFSCVGVAMEVAFTALSDIQAGGSRRLQGYSYLWMFPVYGLVPIALENLYPRLAPWPLAGRLALYVSLLLLVEYTAGWLLRRILGVCPWERNYLGKRWAIHGLVRLDYAPLWALACFVFEKLFLTISYTPSLIR